MAAASSYREAVYTGVFDPVHLGHLDIIRRGSRLYDRLVVGVGINPEKSPFFSIEERVGLLRKVTAVLPNVEVQPFNGLAVHFLRQVGARIMLRGLRTLSDMEYEFSMSLDQFKPRFGNRNGLSNGQGTVLARQRHPDPPNCFIRRRPGKVRAGGDQDGAGKRGRERQGS